MIDFLRHPWPWYIGGPLIGLTIPLLLLIGNKSFGISSTLRDICAACIPSGISFFKYNWKDSLWNLYFVAGIVIGGSIASEFSSNVSTLGLNSQTIRDLRKLGVADFTSMLPSELFSWGALHTLRGFIFIVIGGFLVGFGTRYAGGCTSGHSMMGMANLQWPSLIATICFMLGGIFTTHVVLPILLSLQ